MDTARDAPHNPAVKKARVAAVVGVLALLFVAHRLGVLDRFADPVRIKQTLIELGPWGYVVFVVAYAVLQPFGVPGTVFVVAAPLIWPWPLAYALTMGGTMAASVIGFSFARFVARDWVVTVIPERFRKYDQALSERAFTTVAVLRFVFWMPPLLHAFFGVSRVSFATHFWGSLAGYTLPLFLMSYFGQRLFDWMRSAPRSAWIGLGVSLVLVALASFALRRRALRLRRERAL